MKKNFNSRQTAAVKWKIEVLNNAVDRKVIAQTPEVKNLIVDQGLNYVGTEAQGWVACTVWAQLGTGTSPTSRDSGAITFSRTGTTVTASGSFFEANDAGRLLKFDSGEEVYIASFTSVTEVETIDSGAIASSEGTVWYVDDTTLDTYVKSTGTYQTDSGDCGTTVSGTNNSVQNHKRTYLFPTEVGAVTYNEIGFSPVSGTPIFSRSVIAGGLAVVAGNIVRLIMTLSVTNTDKAADQTVPAPITGWVNDGEGDSRMFRSTGSFINTNGSTNPGINNLQTSGNPAATVTCWLCTQATMLAYDADVTADDVGRIGVAVFLVPTTYTAGSFQRSRTGTFGLGQSNGTGIRSLFIGFSDVAGGLNRYLFWQMLMDDSQEKDSDHTLQITQTLSWQRSLTN